ncbi:MAG TPA: substrate-binding domain-containing protein [Casimicrobiaceae bacterium]|nr:substrate-binding domain-containing protein [Casimicrobiaceae bacterium]
MKRLLALVICLSGLLAFAGPALGQKKETRIGIVTLQMKAPYFIAMVRALEAEGAAAGVKTLVADGGGDVAKVNSDIEDLLAKGVDGLIMNISPLEALPGAMDAIKKANKPLVLVNRRLKGGEYDAWIGVDNFNTAAGVGEVIVKRMGGKGNLLMMRGGPEDNSTGNARRDGVLSKVKGTDIKVTFAPEFGKWTEDGGIRVMEDMLAKHKDINAVFCEGDVMCLGAQKAIADAGRSKQILIFGFDGQKAAIEQIMKDSNFVATGVNSADMIAKQGFKTMMDLLAGKKPAAKDSSPPVVVVTKDNAKKVYNPNTLF